MNMNKHEESSTVKIRSESTLLHFTLIAYRFIINLVEEMNGVGC